MSQNSCVKRIQETIGAKLLQEIAKDPPEDGFFGFSWWLGRVLSPEELDGLGAIEDALGEEEANRWLQAILVESGQCTADGEKVVRTWEQGL